MRETRNMPPFCRRFMSAGFPVLAALLVILCLGGAFSAVAQASGGSAVSWKACLKQKPAWYASAEAVRIADNLLAYQYPSGGWDKNIDMAAPLNEAKKARLEAGKQAAARNPVKSDPSTIDNDATTAQITYLARVYGATKQERFRASVLKGLDCLFKMQYPNGGWRQYAYLKDYHTHITFNDNAMIRVMILMREVARGEGDFAFLSSESKLREKARVAVGAGVDCILKCQVRQHGRLTSWCAQHDEKTLAPAPARKYELASLSGAESVGIVRFLMEIEKPSPEVKAAIEGAVEWFKQVEIKGIRVEEKKAPGTAKGTDKVVITDSKAGPLWARFYELGTDRPFFCGRDGVVKYRLAEIEYERRNGYAWYVNNPAKLLEKDYPAWQARWGK